MITNHNEQNRGMFVIIISTVVEIIITNIPCATTSAQPQSPQIEFAYIDKVGISLTRFTEQRKRLISVPLRDYTPDRHLGTRNITGAFMI